MKYLILILTMFSVIAQADEMPAYMKDGVITVTLKDGKSYTFSSNEYMVVARHPKVAAPVVAVAPSAPKQSQPEVPSEPAYKNRISLVVGYGYNGKLKTSESPNQVDVDQQKGAVGGVVLQRDLNTKYHIMGEALTNQTFLLGIGRGF